MITVVLALGGALAYGVADFLGGVASRRARPVVVTTAAAAIGVVPLLVGLLVLGGRFTPSAFAWGAAAGLAGSVGVLLLYAALAIGPMSVLSPVTSVLAAVVPVVGAIAGGTRLAPLTVVALVVAVVAVVLVASVRDRSGARLTGRGLLAAVVAGCGFGGLVLAYDGTDPADGLAPLVVARLVQVGLVGAIALATHRAAHAGHPGRAAGTTAPPARFWLAVGVCGVFDATANVLIQAALHSSADPATLPVVSVLNALYPVGTVLLATAVLRERLTLAQAGGIVLGLAAGVTLALS